MNILAHAIPFRREVMNTVEAVPRDYCTCKYGCLKCLILECNLPGATPSERTVIISRLLESWQRTHGKPKSEFDRDKKRLANCELYAGRARALAASLDKLADKIEEFAQPSEANDESELNQHCDDTQKMWDSFLGLYAARRKDSTPTQFERVYVIVNSCAKWRPFQGHNIDSSTRTALALMRDAFDEREFEVINAHREAIQKLIQAIHQRAEPVALKRAATELSETLGWPMRYASLKRGRAR
jgi:hypothetical protein